MDKDIFDNRLLYYGLDDFARKRLSIKMILKLKSVKEQYLYKLYVYSRPFINDTWKDYIWDYLQGDIGEQEFSYFYNIYKQKHQHN